MKIFGTGGKWTSISKFKCPVCHEGDLFETPTFSFQKPFQMPKYCPKCHTDYEPEPGFYYGAMFVSYIMTGFFCLFFVMFFHWVIGWSINASFIALILLLAIFFVFIFRLARAIWINIAYNYDPEKASLARGERKNPA